MYSAFDLEAFYDSWSFRYMLNPVLVLESMVELVTEDGDVCSDLHGPRAWGRASIVADGVIVVLFSLRGGEDVGWGGRGGRGG